jgi:tRNA-Thr(GGU) m(6)t(6)A37 methyltransferase TsaA
MPLHTNGFTSPMLISRRRTGLARRPQMLLRLQPIGYVTTTANHEALRHGTAVSRITVNRRFARGLDGLEGFSHVFVLFWLHEVPTRNRKLKVHPRGRPDIQEVGVFATRSPHRPNPIGLTRVQLMRRKGRVLTVKGLDAYDGTPILDIKPYDRWDAGTRLRVPAWCRKLQRENRHRRA